MFIREQLIDSIYDLQQAFVDQDDEMLDIYINSPVTCRWQNWTFRPGYHITQVRGTRLGHSYGAHLYAIEVRGRRERTIEVDAINRNQAASIARKAGYEVCSVNMIG